MKKPCSKLPFWLQKSTGQVADCEGGVVVISDSKEDLRDAEYIVQACNEFPRAIELLTECKYLLDMLNYEEHPVYEEVNEFLTKLKENESRD